MCRLESLVCGSRTMRDEEERWEKTYGDDLVGEISERADDVQVEGQGGFGHDCGSGWGSGLDGSFNGLIWD